MTHSGYFIFVVCLFGMCILRSLRVTSEGRESPAGDPQKLTSVVNEVLLSPVVSHRATHQVYSWQLSDPGPPLEGARSGRNHISAVTSASWSENKHLGRHLGKDVVKSDT